MEFDGDRVSIDIEMGMGELKEFEAFIRPRLEFIEGIDVNGEGELACSALVALLATLKRTKPQLEIAFLKQEVLESGLYGRLHWIYHD